MDSTREIGTIVRSDGIYHEEHIDAKSCFIFVEFEHGGSQGFGGLKLDDDLAKKFEEEVCLCFGVKTLRDLVGLRAFVLRNYEGFNQKIEGLEDVTSGRRFTITGFRRRHCGLTKTKLELDVDDARREISYSERRLADAISRLDGLRDSFFDWDG